MSDCRMLDVDISRIERRSRRSRSLLWDVLFIVVLIKIVSIIGLMQIDII